MFASKVAVSSLGKARAFLTNIKLNWEGLPGTNALAYLTHSQGEKSFIGLAPA